LIIWLVDYFLLGHPVQGGPKSKPLQLTKIVLNRIKACQQD